ncbi:response regulator transcription factor [Pseudarthrobacter sp. W1I19]|uniref:response regulator transcription factor n=1 Tax=Pseudarthrobacter sp. W1I19 TaxID=3042288 RepID=UPI0035940F0C
MSERELEALRLLVSSLSGPEVPRQLYVSINTPGSHIRHIFEKLQVNSPAEPVRRTRVRVPLNQSISSENHHPGHHRW